MKIQNRTALLRRRIEGLRVKGGGGVIVFIDLRKAFDSLHRECIPPLLAAYSVPLAVRVELGYISNVWFYNSRR